MVTWGDWNFSLEFGFQLSFVSPFFPHFCPLSAICAVSPRSGPSLGPSMPPVPRLTVYCNPADSFLQPHFYEFTISPLYHVSKPFIKQYVAAMFAYFPGFVTKELEPQPPWSVCWSRCTVSAGQWGGGSVTSWTAAGSSYPRVHLGGQREGFRSFMICLVNFHFFNPPC